MRKFSVILLVQILITAIVCLEPLKAQLLDKKSHSSLLLTPQQRSSLFSYLYPIDSIPVYKSFIAYKQHEIDSLLPIAAINRNRVQKIIYYLDVVKAHPSKRSLLLGYVNSAISLTNTDTSKCHLLALPPSKFSITKENGIDSLNYYKSIFSFKETQLHTIRLNLLLDRNRIENVKLYLKIVKKHPKKVVFLLGWVRRAVDYKD